jgi:hypothetical protein
VPRLEAVSFQVTPPAYTRRPTYRGRLPQGGLSGLKGTEVRVTATSNRPLSGGTVAMGPDGEAISMQPDVPGGAQVSGSFTIQHDGKLQLHVVDADGQSSADTFSATITLLSDERPLVRLVQPPEMSLATPEAVLPVMVSAEDDYGITKVELYRGLNDSRFLPASAGVAQEPAPTRWTGPLPLPLSAYGLEPGDVIKLFARVEDNDPAGAKGSESAVATVRIISQEDFERMIRTQAGLEVLASKYEQARRRLEKKSRELESLRKEIEALPGDSPLVQEKRREPGETG